MLNYFKQRREALGLTQLELANKLDVQPSTISNWERGETVPRVGQYDSIAFVYQTTAEEIAQAVLELTRQNQRAESESAQVG